MKMYQFTLAAAAAACLLTSSIAAACPGHSKATTASAEKTEAVATVSAEKAGCAKTHATGVTLTGGSGCAKSAAGKGGCAKGATMASGKGGCCAKGASTTTLASVGSASDVKTCTFKPGSVAFKGTVLCNHCDLQKSEACQTMFRTESGCLFTLAGGKSDELNNEAKGGKKIVRVKGTVSDKGELAVDTYRVVRTVSSGASAM